MGQSGVSLVRESEHADVVVVSRLTADNYRAVAKREKQQRAVNAARWLRTTRTGSRREPCDQASDEFHAERSLSRVVSADRRTV
jgi:hypothetical protein